MGDTSWRHSSLPPDWPRRRKRILARDNNRCRLQLPGCLGRASEVHHLGSGDDHGDANLLSACKTCHKTATGQANARRLFRAPRRRASEPHPGMLVPHG